MYAVHIQNLSPTTALPGKVPYEAWYGRKPDISHLRIFGSIAYTNILKKVHSGKLEPTSVKCRMLGWWADETKGYRLEDLETKTLITLCNVRFIEDPPPTDLAVVEGIDPRPRESILSRTERDDTDTTTEALSMTDRDEPGQVGEVEEADKPTKTRRVAIPQREPSKRLRRPPTRFGEEATIEEIDEAVSGSGHQAFVAVNGEPRTYWEAMRTQQAKEWEKAVIAELEQLRSSGTFEWVPHVPSGRRTVGSRFVFQTKRDGDGNVIRYKARIVAKGYSQVPGQDFDATFASVARLTTLRALLSMAAREDWEVHQVDVVGAYLRGDLSEEIYLEPPDGACTNEKDKRVWRLLRPLYGLKQAGRQWKVKLGETMKRLGFTSSTAVGCLYFKKAKGAVKGWVLVYLVE